MAQSNAMMLSTSEDALKHMQVMINNFLRLEDGTLMEDVDMRRYECKRKIVSKAICVSPFILQC